MKLWGLRIFTNPYIFSKTIFHIAIIFYLRYSNIVSIIYTYIHNHIYIQYTYTYTFYSNNTHIYIHILSSYIYRGIYIRIYIDNIFPHWNSRCLAVILGSSHGFGAPWIPWMPWMSWRRCLHLAATGLLIWLTLGGPWLWMFFGDF